MKAKPTAKPANACFSSGPCAKLPGYSLDASCRSTLGRSHRSATGKGRLYESIQKTKEILAFPTATWSALCRVQIRAIEMAMWNLLGERPVDVIYFESFGLEWAYDIIHELKLSDVITHAADYGFLPDLSAVNFDHDVVFTWNGTTSGVKVPNGDFIPADRGGLTICDATSAVFAMEIPWDKLDVTTFSWQKVLGGEAGHGMLILSPRAVQRLESYTPPWPLPKVFRLKKKGKLIAGIFEGSTINTPSMLCNEDYRRASGGRRWAALPA